MSALLSSRARILCCSCVHPDRPAPAESVRDMSAASDAGPHLGADEGGRHILQLQRGQAGQLLVDALEDMVVQVPCLRAREQQRWRLLRVCSSTEAARRTACNGALAAVGSLLVPWIGFGEARS